MADGGELLLLLPPQESAAADATQQHQASPLLWLPPDMWGCILAAVDPKDVCALAAASHHAARLAASRRRGVLLARLTARVHLRAVRQGMQARSTFVSKTCSLEQLESVETCRAQLLEALQV